MFSAIQKLIIGDIEEKREYRRTHKQFSQRVKALPKDERFVFRKMKRYMLNNGVCPDSDFPLFQNLLELFELNAVEGRPILSVIGCDISGFCDELMHTSPAYLAYTEKMRKQVNKEVSEKIHRKG